jgi:hypothetical protein
VYYLLYADGYAMPSKVAFDSEEPSLGRIRADFIPPPHSPISIKRCISRVEKNSALAHADLYADTSCETPLNEGHISILRTDGTGLSQDEPMAIVQVKKSPDSLPVVSIPDGRYVIKNWRADIYPTPLNISIVSSRYTEDTIHTSAHLEAPNVVGLCEFDQITGRMILTESAIQANYFFDPGLNDDVDFASASKIEEPKIEIQDRKKTTQKKRKEKKVEFDDMFENDEVPKYTGPSTSLYLRPTDKDRTSATFDALFGCDEPSIPGYFSQLPSLTTLPAQSIITSPCPSDIKPTPSKVNHDKPKESQARHSKFGVRPV